MRCLVALLVFCWLPSASAAEPTVILLSLDGVRHDYVDRAGFPGLDRMVREGVRAERMTAGFPSSTFPGHVSLATGTYADVHGIVDNRFYDSKRGERYAYSSDASWLEAEPLWIAAERQGVKAATYFWVGSETDWREQRASYREAPFDNERPTAVKVDRTLEWLNLPADERPRLVMSYWAGTDSVGHYHGPDSERIVTQLQAEDAELQRLMAGIDALDAWGNTTLLVVSDHGMTEVSEYVEVVDRIGDVAPDAVVSHGSSVTHVFVADESQRQAAHEALASMPGTRVWPRESLPQTMRMNYPGRTGDLVALASPPYQFGELSPMLYAAWRFMANVADRRLGAHGYDPALPEMGAAFLAMGRGVEPGTRIPVMRQIDVAPTVASLLGIEPPRQSEGVVLRLGRTSN